MFYLPAMRCILFPKKQTAPNPSNIFRVRLALPITVFHWYLSFSLEKPAVIFLLSLGGTRFSFDPDIRFGLDGKPWTMLFWARYKLITQSKFRLHTGVHLGMNFRNTPITINNVPTENSIARRYLAAELAPNYHFTKNISAGAYYLYSRGLDPGTIKKQSLCYV